ncbi:YheC/YheD family protein [Neobacillus mesonae]|uniref:YheC/YheD family endospore coat-associated protein n=1 Tax=Neobacillus mesonae TaxID=1193713 RepID=UPI00203CBCA0|nr:YheC/YheD family protein [Neobacillus mesonae]MCM3567917.1 YheC/YheD family protein [Neobacillus mesonae]
MNKLPLIGILTSKKANGAIAGNGPLFKSLQEKLISLGGISFVFTIEDVNEEFIHGYQYLPEINNWVKKPFPFPDLVYNRVPFRTAEQQDEIQNFFCFLKKNDIPYFNPCFINKYQLYQCFKNHSEIKKFLPETVLVEGKQNLFHFLETHSSIYLKPSNSSRGKGIYRLNLLSSSVIQVTGRKKQKEYETFHDFWQDWQEKLLYKNYLAQEEIQSAEYMGSRFDFRILAHAEGSDYSLTGVGIRQSQKQDVTTHIPSGGRLLPYEMLQSPEHDQFIQTIIPLIGRALSEQFGFFGEFSVDAGVSKTGKYYIYEVNSKPMSFDEPDIEAEKVNNLCRLFFELI